ncbi:uncharacterized protein LOC104418910 [Eucalyptus grandis]|uniref:Uncharacterized protein n=2 Tax=Eucalyptus grandis TaxID=71139 RepID=A0ACC3JEI4_EUCGR|nr:uncharacterized protein LOC104418910 [Eucalyptus grandis]KAK3412648.1 hypothetical protein EUGRSUZ_I01373 [Eucalyptus grandis]
MAYGRRSTASSISEAFTDLSPLPYPVLLILGLIFIFLGTSWYFSLEDFVESTEEQLGWILLAAPLVLLLLVRWLPTSMEDSAGFFATSPWDRRRRMYRQPTEGSSPWGVAALIVLLLVLMQYQSAFQESWFNPF